MAGETEDGINLQAECLPTGSISFGRFETESLSWERRSSFSHNRYLEEVEKYSTPGSVTQKKAYFEAHFKKKGLLQHQTSSLSQSGSEGNRGDYGSEDQMNHVNQNEDNYGGSEQYEEQFHNHEKDGIQFSWYDESPVVSDEIVHEVGDGEGEVTSVNIPIDISKDVSNSSTMGHLSAVTALEPSECKKPSERDDSALNGESYCSTAMTDQNSTQERMETPSGKAVFEADSVPVSGETKKSSSKMQVKSLIGRKTTTLKSKIQSGIHTTRKSLPERKGVSSVAPSKDPRKTANEIIPRPNSGRPAVQRVSATSSASRHNKPELLSNAKDLSVDKAKEKSNRKSKLISDNNLKARKAVAYPPENHAAFPRLPTNRADLRASTTGFNFKSSERAEKRKEFYMRLEEKMHAKELQMNEIQVRTQEEKDAAMKQFRKSLNFKATPMPSFYHGAASGVSNGKKAPGTTAKSSNAHLKNVKSANGDDNTDDSLRVLNSDNSRTLTGDQSIVSREQGSYASKGDAVDAITFARPDEIGESAGASGSVTTEAAETAEPTKEDKSKGKIRQQHPPGGAVKSKKELKISKGRSSSGGKTAKSIYGSAGNRAVRVAS